VFLRRLIPLAAAALLFFLGLAAGRLGVKSADPSEPDVSGQLVVANKEEEKLLNRAFALLREGDGEAALQVLGELRTINPNLASLSYVTALAAAQSGEIAKAMAETDISLGKGERVSDSYALAAAVESLKPGSVEWQSMGDPRGRGDFFLRQAIAADQANAAPRLELGIRLRTKGQNEAAAEMLESARLRLHPVDQAAVIETTLLLIKLEQAAPEALPTDLDPDRNTASLVGSAYLALRRGDNAAAGDLLTKARNRLVPELYYYLLGDPAFVPYRGKADLAPLFQ
jgi:tetratricopeptide (TPR) repeat protein